ncbi:hypothetical protein LINGRAHAP2_LOCUS2595, partial [Linum grandiflorum]
SRRSGKGVGLGLARVKLLEEVTKVRKLEGLISLGSKVDKLPCAAVSPREDLRTPSVSLSRYFFRFIARFSCCKFPF